MSCIGPTCSLAQTVAARSTLPPRFTRTQGQIDRSRQQVAVEVEQPQYIRIRAPQPGMRVQPTTPTQSKPLPPGTKRVAPGSQAAAEAAEPSRGNWGLAIGLGILAALVLKRR